MFIGKLFLVTVVLWKNEYLYMLLDSLDLVEWMMIGDLFTQVKGLTSGGKPGWSHHPSRSYKTCWLEGGV